MTGQGLRSEGTKEQRFAFWVALARMRYSE